MDWIQEARRLFKGPKPAHVTNYRHCCECAEHDETLLAYDIDSIDVVQLRNPGWDPLCFVSPDGFLYSLPALIRMMFDTMGTPRERYLDQCLFHLMRDGHDHDLVRAGSPEQRAFMAEFLAHLIEQHSVEMEAGIFPAEAMLKAYEIWSAGEPLLAYQWSVLASTILLALGNHHLDGPSHQPVRSPCYAIGEPRRGKSCHATTPWPSSSALAQRHSGFDLDVFEGRRIQV